MRPLTSSFTQSDGEGGSTEGGPGRPEKPMEEKSDKTIANINAMH